MDTDMGNPGPFQNTVMRPVQISRIDRLSLGVGEYEGKAAVCLFQFQKGIQCRLIQRNCPLAGLGFFVPSTNT